ncbi:MAG: hypothetical protein GWN58_41035 [Anaerolineae bacterium]|nr:hypothetical protein [Anaerolineae bacterium]
MSESETNDKRPVPETAAMVPVPPKQLTGEEDAQLRKRAEELVASLRASEDRKLVRSFSNLGREAQREASAKLDLLKTRVSALMKDLGGEGAGIPKNLIKLRKTMDEINPNRLSEPKRAFLGLIKKIPKLGDVLVTIAHKYETVQAQIDAIIAGLYSGKDHLLKDSIELDQLYEAVKEQQVVLQKNAYLGEMIIKRLEAELESVTDETRRQRLRNVLHKVAMRVQDLRTMEQVNTQFFVSIDMTIDNNDRLSDSIDRTVMVSRNLLTIGIAIRAALANQQRALKAVEDTQEFASEMLAANAAAIKKQTEEIGDLQNNPVLALDKVRQAYDDLLAAMDESERIRNAGVESAKQSITVLTGMSERLMEKAEALHEARNSDIDLTPEEQEAESGPGEKEDSIEA